MAAPPGQNDEYFFKNLILVIDKYSPVYDKFLLAGDFNSEVNEANMHSFLQLYNPESTVTNSTCFKNVFNTSTIDKFVTVLKK